MSLVTQQGQQRSMISPEQRQLMNERKRIKSYISSYERNPQNWSKSMLDQLEVLTAQYQIPFKRQVPTAGAIRNMAAGAFGALDSAAFGLIPDKWYSSEATRQAANVGKIGGAAAQIAAATLAAPFTGGASIGAAAKGLSSAVQGARGLSAASNIAKEAARLGATTIAKGGAGRLASGAIQTGKQTLAPYGAKQGWKWAENVVQGQKLKKSEDIYNAAKRAIDNSDDLAKVVKGQNLTPGQITLLTNRIASKYPGKKAGDLNKVGENFLNQLKTSKSVGDLKGVSSKQLVEMANSLNRNWNVSSTNVKKLLKKSGADHSDSNVKYIVDKLKEENITKLDSRAVDILVKLARSGKSATDKTASLADIDKWGALSTLGMGAGAAFSLTDYTPSREELMQQEDPYDPYNL